MRPTFILMVTLTQENNIFWKIAPLQEVLERPFYSSKVTAWCVINSKTKIGPYWFEDEGGKSVTVNLENYRNIIRKFCSSLDRCQMITLSQQWFLWDSATPTANATVKLKQNLVTEWFLKEQTIHGQLILLILITSTFLDWDMPKIMCMLTNQGHFRS